MATRILMITQWFDPEPTFKGLIFAKELVRQGYEVEVITGFPNYPGGRLYSGYRLKLLQKEVIDGVHITRVPLYPSHNQSALGRVVNYVSFSISSLVYGLVGAKRPDVLYAYHPPLTVGIVAVLIRLFRRVPVVYDVQDLWPDTLWATGMFSSEKALKVVAGLCRWVYRHVDQLVVLSPGFKRLLIERGVPSNKIEVIYNWCAEDAIASSGGVFPDSLPEPEKFRILFAGNMGRAQALEAVLEAASLLQEQAPHIMFVFLGGGIEVPRLQKLVAERKLQNVTFLEPVPMVDVGRFLASADSLLVHLKRDPLFEITIPSKTQAYMAAGKPLLMAVDGDAADLIARSECGYVAESENPASLARAALVLSQASSEERRAMGQKGQQFYQDYLSLRSGVESFGTLFDRLAMR